MSGFIFVVRFIIRKVRKSKSNLTITTQKGSRFYRAISLTNPPEDKDTIIHPVVNIRNNNSMDAVITRYKMKVLSPRQYKSHTNQLIPSEEKIHYRESQSGSTYPSFIVRYEGNIEEEFLIPRFASKTKTLFFRIPRIIDRQHKELECELKIWTDNNHSASYKFSITKAGY